MHSINTIRQIEILSQMPNYRQQKVYKERVNPFSIPDEQFKVKYRFTKATVLKIVDLVKDNIAMDSRGCGTPAELQVMIALRCWGRGEYQDDAADLHGLTQATVSRICERVARALASYSRNKIKMPTSLEEEALLMRDFKGIRNFPGVIGAVDGTHIKIRKTGGDLAQYYINRKGYYSLNVQVICDATLKIRDIVARWRGSTHDCRIFNESTIKRRFEEGEFKGRLLGDSGYKLTSYLFTPLHQPQNEKEIIYNAAHIATRNSVERCFGVWKQRFRCLLRGMTVSLKNAKIVIVALAVLQNIAIDENDSAPGDCSDSTEDMTVDSRDSKDFNPNNSTLTMEDHHTHEDRRTPLTNHHSHVQQQTKETDLAVIENQNEDSVDMEHNQEEDIDSQPPRQKRPKMEMPEEYRKTPTLSPSNTRNIENSNDSSKCDDFQNQIDESNSKDRRSSSPPRTITPAISPSKPEEASNENVSSPSSGSMPKLRLNTLLASDPALMPDAKDLKMVHEESQTQQRKQRLEQQQHQQQQQPEEDIEITPVEPIIKPTPSAVEGPPRMKVFMCLPCGIGFSSPSTLEAHQAYYCSHRHKETDEDSSLSSAIAEKTSTSPSQANSASANVTTASEQPAAKVVKTGKQYACTQCSYSADKKVSLNRHMRMHQTSPAPSSNASNNGSTIMEENSSQQVDRYCSDCDIRFNNIKTYRAHKQHYCSSRRSEGQLTPKLEVSTTSTTPKVPAVVSGAISPQTRTKTPTPAMVAAAAAAAAAALQQSPATPFLALPTNPILIIPYSLIRSASLIAGPLSSPSPAVINPDTTCFTLDNGNLKPLATALNINALNAASSAANSIAAVAGQQINIVDSTRQSSAVETLLTEKNVRRNVDDVAENTPKRKGEGLRESAPLDLSLRRSPIAALLQRQRLNSAASFLDNDHQRLDMETLLEAGKENLALDETGSITPEQIVCAPSLPNSPSMSPSPRRRAISPRSSGAGSTSSMSPPATIPPNALSAASNPGNILDNLQLRSMLPAELLNPLLAKQNLELALKLSAAAAAAVSSSTGAVSTQGTTPADLAAAVAAAAGRGSLLGLSGLTPTPASSQQVPAGSGNQPQIYVKQGVSKCKECNIVFCKYENYLAHKQHYCSARNQEPTDGEAKVSSTPPMSAGASQAETTPVAYQQLICAACGIKYTSLDNLRAHQNYYCPKGGGVAAAAAAAAAASANTPDTPQLVLPKEKCPKCKTIHELALPCPPPPALPQQQQPPPPSHPQHLPNPIQQSSSTTSGSSSNQNIYKCPLCDAVSLTASESRKHMETHGTVKAFRCTICRYKGNTLRGMRTHIRMHFDKKTSDVNEEHYMACILEDESIEVPSVASLNQEHLVQQFAAAQQQQQQQKQLVAAAAVVAANLQQHQQQQQQSQQVFNCDICNYSSTYKGNVLRHMKLVHPHIITNSPSISPEAGDLETTETASLSSSLNGDNSMNNFTIKSEPMDHHHSTATSSPVVLLNPHDNNNSPIPNVGHNTNDLMHHIKSEPMEISIEPSQIHVANALRSPAIGPPPPLNATPEENINQKYCQTCDISFNYMKTFLAHKQFYCKNKAGRPDDSPSPNAANIITTVPSPNTLMMQKNKENLQQEAAI